MLLDSVTYNTLATFINLNIRYLPASFKRNGTTLD